MGFNQLTGPQTILESFICLYNWVLICTGFLGQQDLEVGHGS